MTHPVITDVTNRIAIRSADRRGTYLERMAAAAENGPARGRLACANLAHGFAASDTRDKSALRRMVKPNIAIVSSYNDMLSAHKPFESITPTNIAEYLKTPNVECVGGSWLTPIDAVQRGDWGRISGLAAVALELANPTMRKSESL
jgi:phosphogluconate dehydratase